MNIEATSVVGKAAAADFTIVDFFEAQAHATPEAIAVSCVQNSLTYGALNRRANQLAHHLIAAGVGPESVVALRLSRSIDMIVSIVAVLKAGGAYLPIDPLYPRDRTEFMLRDAQAALMIADGSADSGLSVDIPVVRIDLLSLKAAARHDPTDADRGAPLLPSSLAYVIYTSGSTGTPKGVCIEHRNVVRLFLSTHHWFHFGASDVWTLFHSYAFDFSVWEIWGALFHGGRLVIVPQETTRAPCTFLKLLADEGVTILNQTPSAFTQLMRADADEPEIRPLALRTIIFGGEALEPSRLRTWYARRGDRVELVNMYGITETTVHVTYKPLTSVTARSAEGISPIGRPIPDLEAFVFDEDLKPVAEGVTGELFIGGAGVARGYLNRPDLTAQRFIDDPHRPGHRLYRSGDLARWNADDELEFFGRADHQVKIRGFRIELGEVEAALLTHPSVRNAAVLARPDAHGQPHLVGYVVTNDAELGVAQLRAHLSTTLPEYMIPGVFEKLATLPLTENGKLDRAALLAGCSARLSTGTRYAVPRTSAERLLSEIWAEALHLDKVGIDDRFLDLGGTSLLLAGIHERVRANWPEASLADLFTHATVRTLAARLEQPSRVDAESETVAERTRSRSAALRRARQHSSRTRP